MNDLKTNTTRKYWMGALLVLLNLAFLEAASFVFSNWLIPDRLIFSPHLDPEKLFMASTYDIYLEARDPDTGWPLKVSYGDVLGSDGNFQYDALGRRLSPAFPNADQGSACISLFGDSFTYSSEVEDEFAWGNVLAEKLGCRVDNFGVGGFGSDQAYIRYINKPDNAPVVFLNHLSENIIRNSTQFRALIVGYDKKNSTPLSFKPKFIVDESGVLEQIEMPTFKSSEYIDVVYNPEKYLKHEYFTPGGDSGLNRPGFPYTLTLLKVINHYHVQAKLKGIPWYLPFYDPDHTADGLRVTAGIMLEFEKLAISRGQTPVLTIIPTGLDLLYYREHKVWPYQNLIDYMNERGTEVINFGTGINERLGDNDPCTLFDHCSSHFNEEGYAYLAEIAYDVIQSRNLLAEKQH